VLIRPFAEKDLDALYAISVATGLSGSDASHLYADPRMLGHIYAAPYALLETGLTLVAEEDDGVVGYVVGVVDTRSWERRLEREWWPSLRRQYANPEGIPPADWTEDQRRADMIHNPKSTPAAVAEAYPSHLHLNLLSTAQGLGVGTKLFQAWLGIGRRRGAAGMHVGVNPANTRGARFWEKQGFKALGGVAAERTLWMGRP